MSEWKLPNIRIKNIRKNNIYITWAKILSLLSASLVGVLSASYCRTQLAKFETWTALRWSSISRCLWLVTEFSKALSTFQMQWRHDLFIYTNKRHILNILLKSNKRIFLTIRIWIYIKLANKYNWTSSRRIKLS